MASALDGAVVTGETLTVASTASFEGAASVGVAGATVGASLTGTD